MSKKLMLVLAINNAVLGSGMLYLYSLIVENDRIIGILAQGLSNVIRLSYLNESYIQQIIMFLSR